MMGGRPPIHRQRPELDQYHDLRDPAIVCTFLLVTRNMATALPIKRIRSAMHAINGIKLPKASVRVLACRYSFTHLVVPRPKLHPKERAARVIFTSTIKRRGIEVLSRVIWSDEKLFVHMPNGQTHLYSPYEFDERAFREHYGKYATKVHVFLAVHPASGRYFLTKVPYGVEGTVDTCYYAGLLTIVADWIRTLPNHHNLIWQQDGAPAHRGQDLAQILAALPVAEVWSYDIWPARSPDLSVAEWPWAYAGRELQSILTALTIHLPVAVPSMGAGDPLGVTFESLVYYALRRVITRENLDIHMAVVATNIFVTSLHGGSNQHSIHGWRRQYGTTPAAM